MIEFVLIQTAPIQLVQKRKQMTKKKQNTNNKAIRSGIGYWPNRYFQHWYPVVSLAQKSDSSVECDTNLLAQ